MYSSGFDRSDNEHRISIQEGRQELREAITSASLFTASPLFLIPAWVFHLQVADIITISAIAHSGPVNREGKHKIAVYSFFFLSDYVF